MADTSVVPFIIGGTDVVAAADRSTPVYSPTTGEVVHHYSSATPADAVAAVEAAHAAFPAWRDTPAKQRRDVLLRVADVMERRRDELAGYLESETGQPRAWADFNITTAVDFVRDAAGLAAKANVGTAPPTQTPTELGAIVLREPYGVVVGIAPWNAPYILGTRAVLFPLAAGNTVVLKGSELSPRTMWAIGSVFVEAGVPAGAVNVVYAAPSSAAAVTEALIAHKAVRKVNFTGSTAVGRVIGRLAGENLKPALLELGGKAPAIVWADADLDRAAQQCALGAFLNAGQICMSTERVIVHADVRAAFAAKLAATMEAIFGGSSSNGLVLISEQAAAKALQLLADAEAKGAHLEPAVVTGPAVGARMRPTIVSGVTKKMELYSKESFAPVVCLFEVTTEAEALALANDTEYGLSAAVFTEDLRRGLRLARGIESGAVHINNMTVHDESSLPHGGVKASGYGRFNVDLAEWVQTKTVTYQL